MDLDGQLVALESRKHWPHAVLSAFLTSFGPGTIVAKDRNTPSHAARQMAAAFCTKSFKPTHSLGVLEKMHAAKSVAVPKMRMDGDEFAAAKKAFDVVCSNKVHNLDR